MQKIQTSYFPLTLQFLKNNLAGVKARFTVSPFLLFFICALYLIIFANTLFFEKLDVLYPLQMNMGFVISLTALLIGLNMLIMLLLHLILPCKVVVVLFLLIAAMVNYYATALGVLVDKVMIQNIVETNLAEALEIINIGMLTHIIVFAALPSAFLLCVSEVSKPPMQALREKVIGIVTITLLIPACLLPFGAEFASFLRLHKELRYHSNPLFPIYSASSYLANTLSFAAEPEFITLTTEIHRNRSTLKPKLMILVVGEAVRADHLALNGYPRDTTPHLSQQSGLINFKPVRSCGTSTAISVPCMFSFSGQDNFNVKQSRHTQNVLDVLASSGVRVIWRDNNSSSKGVADRLTFQDYRSPATNTVCDVECRDVGMLVGLQDYIDQDPEDVLIVLHQMGNHGPAYSKRYPDAFEFFTPACQSAELSNCSQSEIVNAYDNALRYTDHFLADVIQLLQQNSEQYDTLMLYVSDHGESLGENGIYLHGMPYRLAPEAQTDVPVIAWLSTPFINSVKVHQQESYSHDDISGTLLSLFEVTAQFDNTKYSPSSLFHLQPVKEQ